MGAFAGREREGDRPAAIDEAATAALAAGLRERVRTASTAELREEPRVFLLLAGLVHDDEQAGRAVVHDRLGEDVLFLAVLASTYSVGAAGDERRSVPMARVEWDPLREVLGEEFLVGRTKDLIERREETSMDERERASLELASRHLEGR